MLNLKLIRKPVIIKKDYIKKVIESYKKFVDEYHLHKCFIYPIPLNKNYLNLLSNNERIKRYFICPDDEYFLRRKIIFAMFNWIEYIYNLDEIKDYFEFINNNYKKPTQFYDKNKFKIKYVKKLQ